MKIAATSRQQAGFTLIELVTVIVILGILASFALPRFVALDAKARLASIHALEGSLRSASALAHSMALASNNPSTITVDALTITLTNGYPDAATIGDMLQSSDGFTPTVTAASGSTPGNVKFAPASGTSDTNCAVTYTEASSGGAPSILVPSTATCT